MSNSLSLFLYNFSLLKPPLFYYCYYYRYSQRTKFVLVPWCGDKVGVMRKAKLSIQISDVKVVLRSFHIEVPASQTQDLNENEVLTRLRRAGGANYDRQSSNY